MLTHCTMTIRRTVSHLLEGGAKQHCLATSCGRTPDQAHLMLRRLGGTDERMALCWRQQQDANLGRKKASGQISNDGSLLWTVKAAYACECILSNR